MTLDDMSCCALCGIFSCDCGPSCDFLNAVEEDIKSRIVEYHSPHGTVRIIVDRNPMKDEVCAELALESEHERVHAILQGAGKGMAKLI